MTKLRALGRLSAPPTLGPASISLEQVGRYVLIKTTNNKAETRRELEDHLRSHKIVLAAHMVGGSYSYVAILSDDKVDYASFIRRTSDIKGVSKTFTITCAAVVAPKDVDT
jgi:DNA-binding Lrp family transcriptional regulator